MRINIGCGSDIRRFWINCDVNPQNKKIVDFDIKSKDSLEWLVTKKPDIIECNHVIGYLNLAQSVQFFEYILKALNVNGVFIVEFPDLEKICKWYLEFEGGDSDDEYIEIVRSIYAYDAVDMKSTDFDIKTYIFGWSSKFLMKKLLEVGFQKVLIMQPQTHGNQYHRDSRIEAYK